MRDQQVCTRSLLGSSTHAQITTDQAGIIIDVNKHLGVLTGCPHDELTGAPFRRSFTDPDRTRFA